MHAMFSNCLKYLLLGLLERSKCQNIHFFGTSNSVDRHGSVTKNNWLQKFGDFSENVHGVS